jgi:phenylpyruvate tautomerase PptA (4-oxalocrotonate tautomerase family)
MASMNVLVYVEGPSDDLALRALLRPLLDRKRQEGVAIRFFESPRGNKKETLLTKIPQKAANILRNDHSSIVVAMPDLYPKNVAFPHETFAELQEGILSRFEEVLLNKGKAADHRLKERFRVFCFKHDMEALVLAAEEALRDYLEVTSFGKTWRRPVENQDHNEPPKRVVEQLFRMHKKRDYKDTGDAPAILGKSDLEDIKKRCSECFMPFVEFLTNLSSG